METLYTTPILQEKTSTGLDKFWQGQVLSDGSNFYTCSRTYQSLAGGGLSKEVVSTPVLIEPKNVGRANQTGAREQAIAEIKSDEARKRKKGYVAEGESKNILPLPMLANEFTKRKHKLSYPVMVQPKLDGLRMLQQSVTGCWSRGGDHFIPEVVQHLCFETGGAILDGEVILPKHAGGFQQTMQAAKKYRPELSPQLTYQVFDVVDETMPFTQRYERLQTLLAGAPPNVQIVPCETCHSEAEIEAAFDRFIEDGFEGVIIRQPDAPYAIGNRSVHLQKLKVFDNDGAEVVDDEFIITEVSEGKGSFKGLAVFVCRTKAGQSFRVVPVGTREERQEMFNTPDKFIGQELTDKYQGLTDSGKPRFPTGIGLRDRSLQG